MTKDLERADTLPSRLEEGGNGSSVSKRLLILTKSRLPRIFRRALQACLGIYLLLILLRGIAAGAEGLRYSRNWQWPYSWSSPEERFNISAAGPVRMVVFGTPDVWTPSNSKGFSSPGWTETLCEQLGCAYHESLIPSLDLPSQAMTFKNHYKKTLDSLISAGSSAPRSGENYNFVREQYPTSQAPDLAEQVKTFLAREKPKVTPKETIWIFSLGTWDIWTLASVDRRTAETAVEAMPDLIFTQIEHLYNATLDPTSPSHSETPEAFRIIIPEVFDVSLTPGWSTMRPDPPAPHTKVQQMATAAFLTKLWNKRIQKRLNKWMAVAEAPHPRRLGMRANVTEFAMDVAIEKQMRDMGVHDALGRGQTGQAKGEDILHFGETTVPCVWDDGKGKVSGLKPACEKPDDYLFHGPFTMSQRAIRETAKRTARRVMEVLY